MGNYGIYNQPSPRTNREIRVIRPANNLGNPGMRRSTHQSCSHPRPQKCSVLQNWQTPPRDSGVAAVTTSHADTSYPGPVTLVPGGHLPANPRTPEASPPMNRPGTGTDRRGHLPRKKTSPPRGTWNDKQPDGRHLPRDTWSNKRLGFKPL